MKILNFGSMNIDHVYKVSHMVKPGETISSEQLDFFCGGKGLNQSLALARANVNAKQKVKVYHAGAIGADGTMLADLLAQDGVDLSYLRRMQTPTGHAIIQVDSNGQNSILLYGGANQCITREQVTETLQDFSAGDFLILQNEISELAYIIEKAHEKQMKIFLNPSPCDDAIKSLPLEYVDCLLLNEVEGRQICKAEADEDVLEALIHRFPDTEIVLTLGDRGAMYGKGKTRLSHQAYRVPVMDTTAAGDTFSGFYIGCLSQGMDTGQAMHLASVAAAVAVTRNGAGDSIPLMSDVVEWERKL